MTRVRWQRTFITLVLTTTSLVGAANGEETDKIPAFLVPPARPRSWLFEAVIYRGMGEGVRTEGGELFMGATGHLTRLDTGGGFGFVALGVRIGTGAVVHKDARMVEQRSVPEAGSSTVLGGEVRVGIYWPDLHHRAYAFLGLSSLWHRTSRTEPADWLPELGDHRGVRVSIGGTVAYDHMRPIVTCFWDRLAGTNRVAASVGFAF